MLKVNNLKFKKISYIDRFVPVIVVPYFLDTLIVRCFDLGPYFYFFKMEGGWPRMKEKNGVFGCSYCYTGLNRQNNKFQQKGLVFNLKKRKTEKHLLKLMNRCFKTIYIGPRNI